MSNIEVKHPHSLTCQRQSIVRQCISYILGEKDTYSIHWTVKEAGEELFQGQVIEIVFLAL